MGGGDSAGLAPWGWWVRGSACRAARLLGESEVGYLAVAVLVEQQVLRLEVAVEDRALVQVLEHLWLGLGLGLGYEWHG